jgi:Alpha/beta hydrolase domain
MEQDMTVKPIKKLGIHLVRRWRPQTVVLTLAAAAALVACGSSDLIFGAPSMPSPKSAIVAPELTSSCPIVASSIESFVTKGSGPAFNGAQFGAVGTYKYILAEATGKVNSTDPCVSTIVDLKNAADSAGMVTYKFDVIMLTPEDASKGNGSLLYIVNNRTNSSAFEALNDGSGNDLFGNVAPVIPTSGVDVITGVGAGKGYLMKQGMTVVFSGWQGDRPSSLSGPTAAITSSTRWYAPGMTLPVAKENGAKITGTAQDEFIADNASSNLLGTYYPRAANTPATLTIRKTPTDSPITVDASMWTYTPGTGVAEGGNTGATGFGYVTIDRAKVRASSAYAAALDAGSDNGSIYHFNYTATDPKPMGLGFLGVRDLISFLKYEKFDLQGNSNPVAGNITTTLATGISQSGRYLRDFLWLGFNTDKQLRTVFDGMLPLVGGSRKTYTNYRWAKPGDYSRQHETHYTPGDQFPFSYSTITDPLTGKVDGLMKKCAETNNCPKVFQYDGPSEFGGPSNVRLFYSAGTSHGPQQLASNAKSQPDYTVDRSVSATAVSTSPGALNASTALYRALMSNLDAWVKGTAAPVASNWPRVADGTMSVPTADPKSLSAIDLPTLGLAYSGVYNTLTVNDESVIPSIPSNKMYVVHQPTQDGQGNSKAGVKMPDSAVPLASFVGYSIRKSGFAAGDQNGLSSSQLAFALNTSSKNKADTRKSVQELYGTKAGYLNAWNASVDKLVADKLMLADDAVDYKNRGLMQSVQPNFATLGQ